MKIFALPALAILALSACQPTPSYQKLTGDTMGTSYHITAKLPANTDMEAVRQAIDARLNDINNSMSTYDDSATIMTFNRAKAAQCITIDTDFSQVLADSRTIYTKSDGAFDPTVMPLVQLWGFGSKISVERLQSPPSDAEINTVRQWVGLDKVTTHDNQLCKTQDGVALDFSAIAKGYAVDVIADTLKQTFLAQDYMVEIGGEIATAGKNPQGASWQIAIDKPTLGSTVSTREILTTLTLNTAHIATSGNYRNTLEYNGIRYSHTINPATARPVENGAASVTVLHDSTALADGWATALTALPYEEALALANREHIRALFVTQGSDGNWVVVKSRAMQNESAP